MKMSNNIHTHRYSRLMIKVTALSFIIFLLSLTPARAQQYTGMSGLIHTPTADMDSACTVRVGMHAINKHMTPDAFVFEGSKYNTSSWYLSVTPLRWMEIGYNFTLMKFHRNLDPKAPTGFYSKDRYFSLKLQPINEDRWWPSIAIGGNDVWGQHDGESGSFYFRNFYGAASKHFDVGALIIGTHVAYRKWERDYNHQWEGVVGGITLQPTIYKPLRLIGEYDGNGINVGADCCLFRYLLLQLSLQQGKYVSGGACFTMKL